MLKYGGFGEVERRSYSELWKAEVIAYARWRRNWNARKLSLTYNTISSATCAGLTP